MKFKDYLDKNKIKKAKFCKKLGWNYESFQKIQYGGDIKISQALKVEALTNGQVTVQDFKEALLARNKRAHANNETDS